MTRRLRDVVLTPILVAWWLAWLPGDLLAAEWTASPGEPLQPLIDQADDGDRLKLPEGRYPGPLSIDRTLTLQGEPGAVIDGGGDGHAVMLEAPDIVLDGLTIENWGANLTDMDAGIFVEASATGSVIRDSRLTGPGFGIWLDAVAEVQVLDNVIRGDASLRSQDRGNGVHLFNVRDVTVAGNDIRHTRDGIYIDTSSQSLLRSNHMQALRYGVHYMYAHDNRLEGNTTRNTRTGYALMQSKRLEVIGNRSEDDRHYGILMNNITDSTLRGNHVTGVNQRRDAQGQGLVSGAEGKALFVYNAQYNRFEANRFAESDIGIHLTAGSEDNVLVGNAFVDNRQQVMYVATRAQEWSEKGRGNHWSDYLGWDLDGDGVGDMPFEPNDAMDRLLWRYPVARLLMHSPAVLALRWVQRQFPVFRPQGVKDSHPLMKEPDLNEPGLNQHNLGDTSA
ncbi:nitrous oxide reductase family maturation protein NosD [Halomonas rhizosphaerae]|uniref:Nitrous oxide reductase family maturation protein NosD n=1 Tax=Halomonas rhizosphaerae TaxID=3043296 RepID=A0ABT6V3G0_9GAMM|nr:nitrous oxide reductase family maturation protein NosD [Halomonas rhizosphaerae]MDI5892772.1 nitrous oxide reductase family maturation protein NosD [Halomonas rhizosphaerae]